MEIKKRKDVDPNLTWDLRHIYPDETVFKREIEALTKEAAHFSDTFKDKLDRPETVVKALEEYEALLIKMVRAGAYSYLPVSVDGKNTQALENHAKTSSALTKAEAKLSFLKGEMAKLDQTILEEIAKEHPVYQTYIREVLKEKEHILSGETEGVLAALGETLDAPFYIYNQIKLGDISFQPFQAEGKEIDLSYNIFEGVMEKEENKEIRHAAFHAFSNELRRYMHSTAACYQSQVQKEKTLSEIRGYESVFDYLLDEQDVSRELYDRQIDIIMRELSAPMRKYAKLLQRIHGLEKMTTMDLKIDVDPDFQSSVSIEQAKEYIVDGLGVLGQEYGKIMSEALSNRWIDFTNNEGKSTGAFCYTPYGCPGFILMSWSGMMNEVMVLAHELGHAGHFSLCNEAQGITSTRPSMYFIEAPSTTNEIIMARYLLEKAKDKRERRWVLSQIISRTYYHNFVTHFMEAAFQRKVYQIMDEGGSVHAELLNRLFKETLEEFWGDAVSIEGGTELTWMRQLHYYNGLYPYTYSAGLTIGTEVSRKILEEGQSAVDRWIETLKAGGTMQPVELAQHAGVDITTEEPLRQTIQFISDVIDEIEELTDQIEKEPS